MEVLGAQSYLSENIKMEPLSHFMDKYQLQKNQELKCIKQNCNILIRNKGKFEVNILTQDIKKG
jgi:hypothetical protein